MAVYKSTIETANKAFDGQIGEDNLTLNEDDETEEQVAISSENE